MPRRLRRFVTCRACGDYREHQCYGFCAGCYARYKRTGTITPARHYTPLARTADEWLALIDTADPTGCWTWPGRIGTDGYGTVARSVNGEAAAYRMVYVHLVGPIEPGMTLDHECHNVDKACPGGGTCPHRSCVNPAHLRVRTSAANTAGRRGHASRTDECPHGHKYTPENTYVHPNGGGRACRTCRTIKSSATAAQRKAERHARGLRR